MAENIKKFNDSVVNLHNRKTISITGVEKVVSVNENQIQLVVLLNTLTITGSSLEVHKLDVDNGILIVNGTINSFKYNDKKENFIKRVFK